MKKTTLLLALAAALTAAGTAQAATNFFGGHEKKEAAPAAQTTEPAAAEPAVYEEPVEPVETVEVPETRVEPVKETFVAPPAKMEPVSKDKGKVQKSDGVAPAASEPEVAVKFRAIQNQEQRVAVLKKQFDGEVSQLSQMRASLAESFGLDAKKLEKGEYHFDAKTGKLVEK